MTTYIARQGRHHLRHRRALWTEQRDHRLVQSLSVGHVAAAGRRRSPSRPLTALATPSCERKGSASPISPSATALTIHTPSLNTPPTTSPKSRPTSCRPAAPTSSFLAARGRSSPGTRPCSKTAPAMSWHSTRAAPSVAALAAAAARIGRTPCPMAHSCADSTRDTAASDIAAATGTPIYAANSGPVLYAGWNNWGLWATPSSSATDPLLHALRPHEQSECRLRADGRCRARSSAMSAAQAIRPVRTCTLKSAI